MLYGFGYLDEFLNRFGFPKINSTSGFRIIKSIDFEKAYKSGSISFDDPGIYLEYNGSKHRGYMYIKEAYVSYTPGVLKFPKIHLKKCQKINEFIQRGEFKKRYIWSNSSKNDVLDITRKDPPITPKLYPDVSLDVCGYCRKEMRDDIKNTVDFSDSLGVEEKNNDVKVDIFGYHFKQNQISKYYRNKQNFTCERCNVKPLNKLHQRWWHLHHVNGNKIDNTESNLMCLCILCHANVDKRHKANFSTGNRKIELDNFTKQYGDELRRLGNNYI